MRGSKYENVKKLNTGILIKETFETQIQEFLRTLSLTPLPLVSYKKKCMALHKLYTKGVQKYQKLEFAWALLLPPFQCICIARKTFF